MSISTSIHGRHLHLAAPLTERLDRQFVKAGLAVETSRGFAWLLSGIGRVVQSPLAWLSAAFVYWAAEAVLGVVPWAGPVLINILAPIFMGGMMIGCQEQDGGSSLRARHIFAGFGRCFMPLFKLGLLWMFAASLMALWILGMAFIVVGEVPSTGGITKISGGQFAILSLLAFPVLLMVNMVCIHSPGLVAVSGLNPGEAMLKSFGACARNILPFIGYSFALFAFLLLTGLPIFLVFASLPKWLVLALGAVYAIFIGSAAVASAYAAFKDIFYKAGKS